VLTTSSIHGCALDLSGTIEGGRGGWGGASPYSGSLFIGKSASTETGNGGNGGNGGDGQGGALYDATAAVSMLGFAVSVNGSGTPAPGGLGGIGADANGSAGADGMLSNPIVFPSSFVIPPQDLPYYVLIAPPSADNQSTTVNTSFYTPMKVLVLDAGLNPVCGVAVTFSAPDTGPSGSFASAGDSIRVTTDINGIATAPAFQPNTEVGSYIVTASFSGDTTLPASFHLENTAAPAVRFQVVAPTSVVANTSFDVTVTALDPYGNVDSNYQDTITFATTDPNPGVVLPAAYTFTFSDAGVHTFWAGVILVTPGDQTLTVTDSSGLIGSATIKVTLPGLPPGGGGAQGGGGGGAGPVTISPLAEAVVPPMGTVEPESGLRLLDGLFALAGETPGSVAASLAQSLEDPLPGPVVLPLGAREMEAIFANRQPVSVSDVVRRRGLDEGMADAGKAGSQVASWTNWPTTRLIEAT
jgi:hypothetical protein